MGLKMLYFLVLLGVVLASDTTDETSLLHSWISYVISRGIYSVLGSLIILCLIISSLSNKVSDDQVTDSAQNKIFYYLSTIFNQRSEIDDRQTLLENLETFKKEKAELELKMLQSETEMALQIEKDRTKTEMIENELKITLKENESLKKEIESIKREEAINKTYFADQMSLINERNEEAINLLKTTKAERDVAVRLASQIIEEVKGINANNEEQRLAIEHMIKDEAKRILFMDECGEEVENDLNQSNQATAGTSEIANEATLSSESFEDDLKQKHFVTGSVAFQSFLNSMMKNETEEK